MKNEANFLAHDFAEPNLLDDGNKACGHFGQTVRQQFCLRQHAHRFQGGSQPLPFLSCFPDCILFSVALCNRKFIITFNL